MPFPPVFDHPWDLTQPPDTQLANLLGQDIRNLKDDVMQRLSLLSGTFANRPAPEVVNATWGGVDFGLLYFSTDTGQIFQWNGAAWIDVSGSFIQNTIANIQANLVGIVGNGAPQTAFTFNIPGGTIGVNQGIRLTSTIQHTAGAFNIAYSYSLNGVVFDAHNAVAEATQFYTLLNTGALTGVYTKGESTIYGALAGLNWAGNQLLTVTFNAPVTDTIVPLIWIVEYLR